MNRAGFSAESMDRRSFLRLLGVAGGGLALAFSVDGSGSLLATEESSTESNFAPNAYLRITPEGEVFIQSPNPEIGQGIKTALPLVVAEELCADWSRVRVEQALVNHKAYGWQGAGGSFSVPANWDPMRKAGAAARMMLIAAAAQRWSVPVDECRAESGQVLHDKSGRQLGFGVLANEAARQPVPTDKELKLKTRSEYRLLGRRIGGVDNREIVTGTLRYGIDQVLPGMLFATYVRCPSAGGRVAKLDLAKASSLPGVKQVFVLEDRGGVEALQAGIAILADSTYAALSAAEALEVEWDHSAAGKDSWTADVAAAAALVDEEGVQRVVRGDPKQALHSASKLVRASYRYPFLAHATLEPQNCTAWVRDGMVELWAPTQNPMDGANSVAKVTGLPNEKILIHVVRSGGGFGRRLMCDYMAEAAAISQKVGLPIKLVHSREADMAHDFYRCGGFHHLRGGLDAKGRLSVWTDHHVSYGAKGQAVRGGELAGDSYPLGLVPNLFLGQSLLPLTIPTGWWRAPGACAHAWVLQSFLHELSTAAGRDHVEFLLEILGEPRWMPPANSDALHTGRAAGVIRLAAQKAGWGSKLPEGHGLGIAFHFCHKGHCAIAAEVSVDQRKRLVVHRVVCACDVGPVLNRSGAENQLEGGVVDGLSAMWMQAASFEDGAMKELNYNEYPLLRMPQTPRIETHFIESDFPPTGLGEPSLPPLAPAVCNAIFTATGERVRSLPLRLAGFLP